MGVLVTFQLRPVVLYQLVLSHRTQSSVDGQRGVSRDTALTGNLHDAHSGINVSS